jgi:hypothetical protein
MWKSDLSTFARDLILTFDLRENIAIFSRNLLNKIDYNFMILVSCK